ncbi:hypothetical protein THAOC_26588, partial [Thalassiosira oceanica]
MEPLSQSAMAATASAGALSAPNGRQHPPGQGRKLLGVSCDESSATNATMAQASSEEMTVAAEAVSPASASSKRSADDSPDQPSD